MVATADVCGDTTPPSDRPPSRVCVSSLSSSRRRGALSSRFRQPASPQRLARVSLQGLLVGADEVASASIAAPGLAPEEAVSWELFSPLHRVLLVATVAAATSRSHTARRIEQLQRSIHLRDEVLQNMQQKLDDLFDEMNSLQQQYVKCDSFISSEKEKLGLADNKKMGDEEGASCCVFARLENGVTPHKIKDLTGMHDAESDLVDKSTISMVEQEERRMSDLSDFSWSVASSVDNQLSSLAVEQELYNLQKECEEKDATIKELTAARHVCNTADTKRIAELQEILRRKIMVISKLKKDNAALKQMVVELTRAKRASSVTSNPVCFELPMMSNNVLFDMCSTSPSSSDSESPVALRKYLNENRAADGTPEHSEIKESCRVSLTKTSLPSNKTCKSRSTSPFKENRINPCAEINLASRQKQLLSSNGDFKRIRRRSQQDSRCKAPRRWV